MVEKIRNMETLPKHSDGHPDEFRQFLLNKVFYIKNDKTDQKQTETDENPTKTDKH